MVTMKDSRDTRLEAHAQTSHQEHSHVVITKGSTLDRMRSDRSVNLSQSTMNHSSDLLRGVIRSKVYCF